MTKNITKIMQKAIVSLLAVFFVIAKCNAQSIVVQPVGTNVLNGGTATFVVAADSGLLNLTGVSFTWYYTSNNVTRTIATSTNITILSVITNSLLGVVLGGNEAFSVLTIKNVNTSDKGSYYVKASELLGSVQSTSVPLSVTLPPPVITLSGSASAMTPTGFTVQMSTPVGSNVVVEASSDMVNWTPIYTNLDSSGTLTYLDTAAKNYPSRYYRARTQ